MKVSLTGVNNKQTTIDPYHKQMDFVNKSRLNHKKKYKQLDFHTILGKYQKFKV